MSVEVFSSLRNAEGRERERRGRPEGVVEGAVVVEVTAEEEEDVEAGAEEDAV